MVVHVGHSGFINKISDCSGQPVHPPDLATNPLICPPQGQLCMKHAMQTRGHLLHMTTALALATTNADTRERVGKPVQGQESALGLS